MSPSTLYDLTSPWYGRSNVLEERLQTVFRGTTFGELRRRRPWPRLLVTATDLTTGAPFEFTPEQFALICSDLDTRAAVVRGGRVVVGAAAAQPDDGAQPCGQLPARRAAPATNRARTATSRRGSCA